MACIPCRVDSANDAGASSGYEPHAYAYAQQPADAQAAASNEAWLSQYQSTGTASQYQSSGTAAEYAAAYDYSQAGQAATHDGSQPPPPPLEAPPPPPA